MQQMHRPDNDAGKATIRFHDQPDQAAQQGSSVPKDARNGGEPKHFTVTCQRCGAWTPADEFEDELKCCRCGSSICQNTDIVVNFRPGMTPAMRLLGRVILAVVTIMVLVTAWLLISRRAP